MSELLTDVIYPQQAGEHPILMATGYLLTVNRQHETLENRLTINLPCEFDLRVLSLLESELDRPNNRLRVCCGLSHWDDGDRWFGLEPPFQVQATYEACNVEADEAFVVYEGLSVLTMAHGVKEINRSDSVPRRWFSPCLLGWREVHLIEDVRLRGCLQLGYHEVHACTRRQFTYPPVESRVRRDGGRRFEHLQLDLYGLGRKRQGRGGSQHASGFSRRFFLGHGWRRFFLDHRWRRFFLGRGWLRFFLGRGWFRFGKSRTARLHTRWYLFVRAVGVAQLQNGQHIAHLPDHLLSILVGERKRRVKERCAGWVRTTTFIPAGPQPIDVAMVQPKDWVTRCPGHGPHVFPVADEDMHIPV